jgi:hypothetical protein
MPGAPIKIGYSLSLTGGLAATGQSARLAHQIWPDDVNARGGWTRVGSLGSDSSLLSRDPDGNLLEFVGRTTP